MGHFRAIALGETRDSAEGQSDLEALRSKDDGRPALLIGGLSVLAILASLFIAWLFIDPAPPQEVTIATGSPGGFYERLGARYKAELEEAGLTVTLMPSNGSVDNVQALKTGTADLAFIQGGLFPDPQPDTLASLASVSLEPLWLFSRGAAPIEQFDALSGLTLAAGPEGSGTRLLAQTLIRAAGLEGQIALDPASGAVAADKLRGGAVDAAMFITAASTGAVRDLLEDPDMALARLERAPAFARQFPYLSVVDVPKGSLDLVRNVPAEDTDLLAPATTLIAQADLHPALVSLVLDVATKLHGRERVFGRSGAFPSKDYLELPLAEEARRYFERGPSFLRRYLPFWAANMVERLWVLIIPLITIMIPLGRMAPPAYRWQVRRRIYRWYEDLRDLETIGRTATSDEQRKRVVHALEELQAEVGEIKVPLAYTDDLYHLRLHIDFVSRLVRGECPGVKRIGTDEIV